MKRIFTMILLFVICFVLQTSVCPFFAMAEITPNLLLIFVVSFAVMRGQTEGMLLGFFMGLLMDITGGNSIGFYALIYLLMGYVSGLFQMIFFANEMFLPLIVILGNSVIYEFTLYVLCFLLRNKTDFLFYFRYIMIPDVIYTFFVAIFLYYVFYGINRILERNEKKERGIVV